MRLSLVKRIYWSDRYKLLKLFKIVLLGVDRTLLKRFACCKGALEVSYCKRWQRLCENPLDGENFFKTVISQAFHELLEQEIVCGAQIDNVPWQQQGCKPYPGQIGSFKNGGVVFRQYNFQLSAVSGLFHFTALCWPEETSLKKAIAEVQEIF